MIKKIIIGEIVLVLVIGVAMGQVMRWKFQYPADFSTARKLIYLPGHTICVAGHYQDFGQDIMVLGLDTLGHSLWGPICFVGEYTDIVFDMIYSAEGNIYLAGSAEIIPTVPPEPGDVDALILSATGAGVPLWYYLYDYAGSYDEVFSVVQDRQGNLYAAGYNGAQVGPHWYDIDFDFAILSLTSSGSFRWCYQYDNAGSQQRTDAAKDIVYGEDGNLYICGYISNDTLGTSSHDLAVMSLTTIGTIRWLYIYNGPGDGWDGGNSIVCHNGKLYVAGFTTGSGTAQDITVLSLDTLGQLLWVYHYNGSLNVADEAYEIIYGEDENLYVAGYTGNMGTGTDFTVISLDTLGNERWVYVKNGISSYSDMANALTYAQGRIYSCGYIYNGDNRDAWIIASLDTSGTEKWIYTYDGAANGYDQARSITFGEDRNIYIAGWAAESEQFNPYFTVISLRDTSLYIAEENPLSTISNSLSLRLTTPAHKTLSFLISSSKSDIVTFSVYNTLGQRLHFKKMKIAPGSAYYNLPLPKNLTNGIYFLRAETSEESITKKFVLIE